ncbi:unnamed protein product [Ceratitis capitata]|uniref:(Mediterranean fruit fly) hypothetical protein n=1 Tax=Ceratitis capitata TaxID=7213 RepID=A0A811USN8_CERCA|nr:unnamed protein product [Ceratitis capitata]
MQCADQYDDFSWAQTRQYSTQLQVKLRAKNQQWTVVNDAALPHGSARLDWMLNKPNVLCLPNALHAPSKAFQQQYAYHATYIKPRQLQKQQQRKSRIYEQTTNGKERKSPNSSQPQYAYQQQAKALSTCKSYECHKW